MFKKVKAKSKKFAENTKDSVVHINELKSLFQYRFSQLMQNKKIDQSTYVNDFELVLKVWGIDKEEIPNICKDLKYRLFFYVILFVIASMLFFQGSFFIVLLLLLACFFGITTTTWRISILKKKQFTRYSQYLLSLCLFPKKMKENK